MELFSNSEIPGNFQFKKAVYSKYFHLITNTEYHEHFEELTADCHS